MAMWSNNGRRSIVRSFTFSKLLSATYLDSFRLLIDAKDCLRVRARGYVRGLGAMGTQKSDYGLVIFSGFIN